MLPVWFDYDHSDVSRNSQREAEGQHHEVVSLESQDTGCGCPGEEILEVELSSSMLLPEKLNVEH